MKKVGWIGTGRMGGRMSARLMDAGYPLFICDTNPDNTKELQKKGAAVLGSAEDVTKSVDIVFSMLPSQYVLKDVAFGDAGVIKALDQTKIFVDMSTVDPKTTAEISDAVEQKQSSFLRAPVSGSTAFAEQGTLKVLASGNKDAYETVLPLFKVLSDKQYYLGGGDEGHYAKIAVNMLLISYLQSLSEALVFGEKTGLDWQTLIDIIGDSAAAAPIVNYKKETLKNRDFTPMSTINTAVKDIGFAIDIGQEKDIPLPTAAISAQFLAGMKSSGRGELDLSAVLLAVEELCGIKH
ncbi:MAG: NAD(P)-dependent oxidoreductase [Christensenellaceae bacterium]|jgi:3-hydroxyisobutyrate dehydrogenase-like beta-hydroxyacid dehydrogenase